MDMARADNDSWDLGNGVGATATMVAAARAAASRGPNAIAADAFAEHLVRAVGTDFFTQLATGGLDFTTVGGDGSSAWMPQLFGIRTVHFDKCCIAASQAGIRQAVNLASGLDSRAYRLQWPADAVLYEIDKPEIIEFKQSVLARQGVEPHVEVRTVGVDLRDDWTSALSSAGFDALAPTVWVAEGLMIGFLPGDAQDRLIEEVTRLSASGSRLAADHVPGSFDTLGAQMRHIGKSWNAMGFDVDFNNLYFAGGEHNNAEVYLRNCGWSTSGATLIDLFANAGLAQPAMDMGDGARGVVYVTATRN
jgi:methyltransferase (TIGR00027 family)